MRRYSRLGVAAIAIVVALVGLDLLLTRIAEPQSRVVFAATVRLTVYGLAAIAAAIAANTFGWWHEPIGRPWTLLFIEFALLFVNYVIRRTAPDATIALDTTVTLLNIAEVGAFWLMSRTLQSAGIGYLIDAPRRAALTVAAFAIALAIAYTPVMTQVHAIQNGTATVASAIAVFADVVTFTLIAPLAMSMFALRGGQVFWVFAFLTISVFGFMFNQAGAAIAGYVGGDDDVVRMLRMVGIAIAALFTAAAALAQWSAARQTMRGAIANA